MSPNDVILETHDLCKEFGGLVAVEEVSLQVRRGSLHSIIGPNGAGKTTFFNLLTGVLLPSRGSVLLEGEDVTLLAQTRRVKRGIARTFQINQLFRGLTVQENVCIAVSEWEHDAYSGFQRTGIGALRARRGPGRAGA